MSDRWAIPAALSALAFAVLALLAVIATTAGADPLIVRYGVHVTTPDEEHALRVQQAAFGRRLDRWVEFSRAVEYAVALDKHEAAIVEAQEDARAARRSAPVRSEQGTGRCGGDLPPCYVMERESRGDIRAENPVSTAAGKWQFIDGTWDGYGGYSHASDAPEDVQDQKARELWDGGNGCGHWSAC